ncbi:MAG: hypothetical protein DDT25_01014 [Chloroflexi bacterium]|nr:hypothetical protein [Chloroflexota bacterium]
MGGIESITLLTRTNSVLTTIGQPPEFVAPSSISSNHNRFVVEGIESNWSLESYQDIFKSLTINGDITRKVWVATSSFSYLPGIRSQCPANIGGCCNQTIAIALEPAQIMLLHPRLHGSRTDCMNYISCPHMNPNMTSMPVSGGTTPEYQCANRSVFW